MKTIHSLTILLLTAASPSMSRGAIIFTNLGAGMSYDITQGNPVGNDFAGDNSAQGDTFTPTSSATLSSIELALSCVVSCSAPESFVVSLRGDSSGSPGAAIETFNFTGVTLGALGTNHALVMATSILHPTLSAGTHYWVTVNSSVNYAIAWNDNSTGDISSQAISSDGGASWFAPSGMTPSAYEVDGVVSGVPEPGRWLLLSTAAGPGWVLLRRRRG